MSDGDYQFEYAKSGRSTCKISGNKIPNKALRVGRYEEGYEGHCYPKWMEYAAFEKSSLHVQEFQQSVGQGKEIMGVESLKAPDKAKVKKLMSGIAVVAPPPQEDSEEEEEEEEYYSEDEMSEEEEEEEIVETYARSTKRGIGYNSNYGSSKTSGFSFGSNQTKPTKSTTSGFNFGAQKQQDSSSSDSDSEDEQPIQTNSSFNFISNNSGFEQTTPSFSNNYSKEDAEKYRQRIRNEENLKNSGGQQSMDNSMMSSYQMPKFAKLDPDYASRILLTDLSKVEMQLMLARLIKADPKFEGVLMDKLSKIVSQRN
eukprot:gene3287-5728_t